MQDVLVVFADDDQADRGRRIDGAKPLFVFAQLLLGFLPLGDVGVDGNKAAPRHRIAPHFQHRAVRAHALK